MTNEILAIDGRPGASVQVLCLRVLAFVTRQIGWKGLQRSTWLLGRYLFDPRNNVALSLAAGGKLRVYLKDGYWIRLLSRRCLYEPDIGVLLGKALRAPKVVFFDCGANIGYWSAVASNVMNETGSVIAIEAAPENYAQLTENARLNDDRFACTMRAIWSSDDQDLTIVTHADRHAGSSVVDRGHKIGKAGYTTQTVRSITLDTLCELYAKEPDSKIVIKLDVEGAEVQALEGAARLLKEREALLLYEDHVQDRESKITDYIFSSLKYEVYHCAPNSVISRVKTLSDVDRVKAQTHADTGHNFAACAPGSAFSLILNEP